MIAVIPPNKPYPSRKPYPEKEELKRLTAEQAKSYRHSNSKVGTCYECKHKTQVTWVGIALYLESGERYMGAPFCARCEPLTFICSLCLYFASIREQNIWRDKEVCDSCHAEVTKKKVKPKEEICCSCGSDEIHSSISHNNGTEEVVDYYCKACQDALMNFLKKKP